MKYVAQLSDIPRVPHYVIVTISSFFIPGDERSRTNPGHGYPERTEYATTMRVTEDKLEWVKEITKLTENDPQKKNFVAYHVDSIAKVTTAVEVNI